nr:carboxypeptidase regulatory-like domain-containing protein [Pyrinomonadaceae bacterium]
QRADNTPLDTAAVTIENLDTHATRTTKTDGGGFFGAVDLAPGSYRAQVESFYYCFNVTPGLVANATLDNLAPETTAALAPAAPDGQNGWFKTKPSVTLSAMDNCSGVAATEYSTDGGATWQPYSGSFIIHNEGTTTILYRSTDRSGNAETAESITLNVDTIAPAITLTAMPSQIWPPNGRTVNVLINGTGTDSVSGLASVSYVVTDEYGLPLGIPARALSGTSSEWTETLGVEARRNGSDTDGRLYIVVATITDLAGNTASVSTTIVVPHDRGRP